MMTSIIEFAITGIVLEKGGKLSAHTQKWCKFSGKEKFISTTAKTSGIHNPTQTPLTNLANKAVEELKQIAQQGAENLKGTYQALNTVKTPRTNITISTRNPTSLTKTIPSNSIISSTPSPLATQTPSTQQPLLTEVVVTSNGVAHDLKPTLSRIAKKQKHPHRNDGTIFQNRPPKGSENHLLPVQPLGYYREFVYSTPGTVGTGKIRLVVGQNGEAWLTLDHYQTFIQIR